MNHPRVSICVPTYNQTFFLKKTLDSIFNQDFKDYEVVISDDSTVNDVEKLVQAYPQEKIKYFRNKNPLGSPKNWNNCIKKASGKYIKILHHDDWFSEGCSLSKFINAIESKPNIDFVFCISLIQNNKSQHVSTTPSNIKKITKDLLLTKNVIGAPSATIFKKNIYTFDEKLKWLVDVDFYMQIIKTNNFIFIQEPLIYTTNEAEHQITNECRKKEIELGEWFYIFNKHKMSKFKIMEILYLIKIMYRYKIISMQDLGLTYTNLPNKKILSILTLISRVLVGFKSLLIFKK
jgi:glycosyltransferase involved in cell wall biosynthesis